MPTVSVVIPAYDAGRFLADAVVSVLAQTHAVAEVIVVDAGSRDDPAAALGSLLPHVRLVRQRNAGPSAARNRGIELATSPWVAFLDADDVWLAPKLAEQFAVVADYPEVALVASDMAETDASGAVVVPSVLANRRLLALFERADMRPIRRPLTRLLETNFIPTGTVLAKRDALLEAGGFPPAIRYGEDLALWARVAARHPIVCLPTVHMLRRRHDTNLTRAGAALYVDVARVVDGITRDAREALLAEGASPRALRAGAWADAAYSLFLAGRHGECRAASRQSLRAMPNLRALRYLAGSLLPDAVIAAVRNRRGAADAS